jgi:hypothetical protein
MREVTVTLGGKQYTVRQLPMRAEAEWRKRLQMLLAPIMELVKGYDQIVINTPADVVDLLQRIAPLLLNAPDTMLELLFDYSPELAIQADVIETTAYSDEVLEALKAVLGLAYPFASDLVRLSQAGRALAANGAQPTPTATM